MDLAGNETHLNLAGFEGESTYFSRGFVAYGKEGRFSFASSSVDMAHIDNPMVPMYSLCLKELYILATLKKLGRWIWRIMKRNASVIYMEINISFINILKF